ncbi:hypothetical protein ILFOPFJJ_04844 [Ensifer psoraleae]|nr:hypothetical protein [Sinorhizobium psoraleae]
MSQGGLGGVSRKSFCAYSSRLWAAGADGTALHVPAPGFSWVRGADAFPALRGSHGMRGAGGKPLRTFPAPGVLVGCGVRAENRFALFLHPGFPRDAGCGRKTASHFSCTRVPLGCGVRAENRFALFLHPAGTDRRSPPRRSARSPVGWFQPTGLRLLDGAPGMCRAVSAGRVRGRFRRAARSDGDS